ncbi:ABC-2 type transport system permease protein [Butyrivibrio sp. INlla18]|uniref:ABC transporter permease n=1 Tax=Butyrivibrio sp. INlla18 TaxID=1520806 RepID=UPI00088E0207|nr:ABC-2 type transport system permease protein [Butyrivibrio sp. INlla18]
MKYRRSKLGVLWSVLTPLGLAAIVGGVYAILFGTSPASLIPLIFASINPWSFMSGTADVSTGCFMSAEGYIKQSSVGTIIFPVRITTTNFVNLMYSTLAFFTLYLIINPDLFNWKMLMCIPGFVLMYAFTLGLASITSIVNLFFRDFAPIQSLMLQGLFYATPIIYDTRILDEKGYSIIYEMNPFYYMIEVVRRPMLGVELPDIRCYIVASVMSVIICLIGISMQVKYRNKIVFQL